MTVLGCLGTQNTVSIHLTKGFLNKPGTGESLCGWEGSS